MVAVIQGFVAESSRAAEERGICGKWVFGGQELLWLELRKAWCMKCFADLERPRVHSAHRDKRALT